MAIWRIVANTPGQINGRKIVEHVEAYTESEASWQFKQIHDYSEFSTIEKIEKISD